MWTRSTHPYRLCTILRGFIVSILWQYEIAYRFNLSYFNFGQDWIFFFFLVLFIYFFLWTSWAGHLRPDPPGSRGSQGLSESQVGVRKATRPCDSSAVSRRCAGGGEERRGSSRSGRTDETVRGCSARVRFTPPKERTVFFPPSLGACLDF